MLLFSPFHRMCCLGDAKVVLLTFVCGSLCTQTWVSVCVLTREYWVLMYQCGTDQSHHWTLWDPIADLHLCRRNVINMNKLEPVRIRFKYDLKQHSAVRLIPMACSNLCSIWQIWCRMLIKITSYMSTLMNCLNLEQLMIKNMQH